MPGDVGGMDAAVVPVHRMLERVHAFVEDAAVHEQGLGPVQLLQPLQTWHEPTQVWPCACFDRLPDGIAEQPAVGRLVPLPGKQQLPRVVQPLEALAQGRQAAGEHDHPALGLPEQWVCRGSCHPLRCCTKTKIRRADRPRYLRPSNKFHSYR